MNGQGRTGHAVGLLSAALFATGAGAVENSTAAAPQKTPAPQIFLESSVVDRNPRGFAERLSTLLGVEVRLPARRFSKLEIPAGEWTTTRLLDHVAKQIDGSWQVVYRLKTQIVTPPASPDESKLPQNGRITLTLPGVTYPRAVKLIEEAHPCVIELPDGVPPGRIQIAWKDEPLERALDHFARTGGLRVVPLILFELPDETRARDLNREATRLREEAQHQGAVAQRLEELYGRDPYSDDFPWDSFDREGLCHSLGRELDLSPGEVDVFFERVRLEALTRQHISSE